MEIFFDFKTINDEPIELPAGFRFHPTDEELITHYLSPKVLDSTFNTEAVGDVDLNKVEPWDLPWKAKMGEKEWYFFCVRDRKYPTGLRTNRATDAGYWKATGKDKEIYRAKILIGMKKTLVFYRGRAPRGVKSNWVMHEYRLEGNHSMHNIPKTKNEWVICRIFNKSSGGKKVHISELLRNRNCGTGSQSSDLPPLMDLSSDENPSRTNLSIEGSYVTCFSNPMEDHKEKLVDEFNSSLSNCSYTPFSLVLPNDSTSSSCFSNHMVPFSENAYGSSDSVLMQDQSIQRISLEKQSIKMENSLDTSMNNNFFSGREVGFNYSEDQEFPFVSTGSVELDCLWNY